MSVADRLDRLVRTLKREADSWAEIENSVGRAGATPAQDSAVWFGSSGKGDFPGTAGFRLTVSDIERGVLVDYAVTITELAERR